MIERRTLLACSPLLLMPSGASAADKPPLRANPATLPPSVGFSHLAEARGRLIWISGQVPRTVDGQHVAPGDFVAQLEQVFRNLDIAVREAGGLFADIVKLNYYCHQNVDRSLLRNVNIIRDRYVDVARPPASTFVFVAGLARPEWLIEIEAVLALAGNAPEVAVHATLSAEKPLSPTLLRAAEEMAKLTRSEDGCLAYRIGRDVESSSVLLLTERWRSEAALRLHFTTPHMRRFQAALRAEGGIRTGLEMFELGGQLTFSAKDAASG